MPASSTPPASSSSSGTNADYLIENVEVAVKTDQLSLVDLSRSEEFAQFLGPSADASEVGQDVGTLSGDSSELGYE